MVWLVHLGSIGPDALGMSLVRAPGAPSAISAKVRGWVYLFTMPFLSLISRRGVTVAFPYEPIL